MEKEPKIKLARAVLVDVPGGSSVAQHTSGASVAPSSVDTEVAIESISSKNAEPEKFNKKFLFVTEEALSVDLAWKIKEEGNEVKFYVGNEDDQDIGEGFVEKCDDWKPFLDWADVIVFDDVISGGE